MRGELLEEERHALGRLEDRRRERLVQRVTLGKGIEEAAGVVSRERVEHRRAVAPCGSPLEKLRSGRRDHEQGALHGADHVFHQIEELVGTAQWHVVEHDDDRAGRGEVLDEGARRGESRIRALDLAEPR